MRRKRAFLSLSFPLSLSFFPPPTFSPTFSLFSFFITPYPFHPALLFTFPSVFSFFPWIPPCLLSFRAFILKYSFVHSFFYTYSYFFLFLSLLSYRAMLSCVNFCTFTHEKMHALVNSHTCLVALTTSVN